MISITSEKSSVQSNQSTFDQANQTQETEELHIVNEATSGEQSKSGQNGAEHPGEETASAEQDFCKTGSSERANKYKYTAFEGYAGERYLQEIMKDILPRALARTWAAAVSYQAPSNACYVGVGRLAQRERLGERTIQKNFQEMRRRGLLRTYGSWTSKKGADGSWSQQAIVVKDFSRLYDLAYEYHLWVNAEEHIPAEWEYADLIRENKELYKKLIRFDNYRHILCCEKPGPKEQLTELQEHYIQYDEKEQNKEHYGPEEAKANNYLPKQLDNCSPYRESKNLLDSIKQENSNSKEDSEGRVLASVVPTTIRNTQQSDYHGNEEKIQETRKVEEKQYNERKEEKGSDKSHRIEIPKIEEISAETAKEVEEYTIEDLKNNPLAMTAFLLQVNEQEKQKQQEQEKRNPRHGKGQPKRQRRATPEPLARVITQMMQLLGGNAKYLQSDLTRATKLYWACTQIFPHFTNGWFLNQLNEVCVKTAKARRVHNRVGYFFESLENELQLTMEQRAYIRSQDALYKDGHLSTFAQQARRAYQKSQSPLDYHLWIKQTYHLR